MSTSKNRQISFGPVMSLDGGMDEPDGNPVASFPPGHVSRLDSSGNLHVYRGLRSDGAADRRPSKLRDAASRLNANQALNARERAASSERLANINQRNRSRYDQDNPWGRKP